MFSNLKQDIARNASNRKGQILVISFRFASYIKKLGESNIIAKVLSFFVTLFYKVIFDYIMSIYIPLDARIGEGFVIFHGFGIVLNKNVVIGKNCTIRHNTTIGTKNAADLECPRIGDDVDIGAGAILLGNISIGSGAIIGAGAVVLRDVPVNAIAVGNPARIIVRDGEY